MLHPLVRWLGRRCLRWFYRDRCVLGINHIPATGPVLLIGNHPNDIPDVLLGYLTTHRPVRYVGTISGATSPITRATYRGLGVIPVTRIRDARKQRELGVDAAATNAAAFQSVTTALKSGAMVAVFPEGGVTDEPVMGPFRGGAAKMALDCIEDGANIGLQIVPIGVHYDCPRTPRTDVTVVIGAACGLDDWLSSYHAATSNQPQGAAHPAHRASTLLAIALRNRMREALLTVTRNAPTWELAQARDQLTALVGALRASRQTSPLAAAAYVQHACAELLHTAINDTSGADSVPQRSAIDAHAHLIDLAHRLSGLVTRAGARPESPGDCARVLHAAGVQEVTPCRPSSFVTVLSAPVALLGLALHAPAHAAIWRHAHRIAADRAELVGKAFVTGVYFMVLWYATLGVALATLLHLVGTSVWWAIPAVMLLPRLGDVAVWWQDAVRALRLRARVMRWTDAERAQVREDANALRVAWARQL